MSAVVVGNFYDRSAADPPLLLFCLLLWAFSFPRECVVFARLY